MRWGTGKVAKGSYQPRLVLVAKLLKDYLMRSNPTSLRVEAAEWFMESAKEGINLDGLNENLT